MVNLYSKAQAFAIRDAFLRDFTAQLGKDITLTEGFVESALSEAAARALAILLRATPVDTGHLLFNWQAGIGESPSGELDGEDVIGDTVLARETPKIPAAYSGDVLQDIVLGNDVDYGGYVNNGTDRLPPRLFVEAARDEIASGRLFPDTNFKP